VLYNVADLLKGDHGRTASFEVDEEPQFEISGAQLLGNICGTVDLMRSQNGILVQADLSVEAEVTCVRCLAPTRIVLAVHLEEEFRATIDIVTGNRIWPEPDEDIGAESFIDNHHILNLDEVVRQELELAVPMKPLCSEACLGLCARCGKNLNEGPCECEAEYDMRWEVLRQALGQSAT